MMSRNGSGPFILASLCYGTLQKYFAIHYVGSPPPRYLFGPLLSILCILYFTLALKYTEQQYKEIL